MGQFHLRFTDPETGNVHEFSSEHAAKAFWDERARQFEPPAKAPAIRPDTIEMWNPLTGGTATSKSQYYKDVKAAGCVINDEAPRAEDAKLPAYQPKNVGMDVKRAFEEAEARGFKPRQGRPEYDRL